MRLVFQKRYMLSVQSTGEGLVAQERKAKREAELYRDYPDRLSVHTGANMGSAGRRSDARRRYPDKPSASSRPPEKAIINFLPTGI
jgi:hypothetical protein